MVRAGCSLRNAAKYVGVNIASVYYACRTDQAFAAKLRSAEQERDANNVPWLNNPWRAAASLRKRADVPPPDPDQADEDPAVEAAAQEAYQRLLSLLHG
jgi:hypothetical protein